MINGVIIQKLQSLDETMAELWDLLLLNSSAVIGKPDVR
jgi:hypothetical protein